MAEIYLETEHQELFYLEQRLQEPIAVHIPSALGKLGYYVCVRVPSSAAAQLTAVSTRLVVGGLRPDDVTAAFGVGVDGPSQYASSKADQVWVVLCRARVSRGDGVLTFAGVPDMFGPAPVLLCTWLRFITSGQADDYLTCQRDPNWAPNGVPLGGIGCGKVEISRDGRWRNFSGNNNQDMPFEEPDGLAGACLTLADADTECVLATRGVGDLPPCSDLQFQAAFPQARLQVSEALPEISVDLTFSGPLTPHDLTLACLPGFVLRWQVTNQRSESARIRCRLAWPNLVGQGGAIGTPESSIGYADGSYRYWSAPPAPVAEICRTDSFCGLRYGNAPSEVNRSADGEHLLAVRNNVEVEVDDDPRRGSVTAILALEAGATAIVDMAVVWAMPIWVDALGSERQLAWLDQCADGEAVMTRLFARTDDILQSAGALQELLVQSSLPAWLRSRLLNCCYPLVTNSVRYRDGRFSINEGPTEMMGCYGTLDQRLAAHPATLLLFPELNARELGLFAAVQSPNGGCNHDLGAGHLEREPVDQGWPDLTCSFILQHAIHGWFTGDRDFLADAWPRVRRALLRHGEWADAGAGVAQVGSGLGTSYDGYHYEGTTPYMATLWLAALGVCRRWAREVGDNELLDRIAAWQAAAIARLDADLWNGDYYRSYGSVAGPTNENCHAGMLAGQFYSLLLTGEDILPRDRLERCAASWLRLQGSDRFAVPPDEVRPDGSSGSEYGWLPYVEAFGLAPLASIGTDIMSVWQRLTHAVEADGARPCDTRLMYRPSDGAPSWGAYYMTAPAAWLVYQSLIGFAYRPGDGVLRLDSQLTGTLAIVHPLWWGLAEVTAEHIEVRITQVFTERPPTVRALELPCPGEGGQRYRLRSLPEPIPLVAGAVFDWSP